jgi:glycosyltransferase involved in cell wall biosynthesis
MIKVVWLCPYNINSLAPELKVARDTKPHNSSWIENLSKSIANGSDVELHIITHSPVVPKTQALIKNNIRFHVIKYSIPFTNRGFPWYFPMDKLTRFHSFSYYAKKIIAEIKPDVLHVHGTEGAYFLPTLGTKIPCIISIQGIMNEIVKIEPSITGYLQAYYERFALKNGKYFGCRTNFDFDFVKKNNRNAVIIDLPEAMNNVFFEHQWQPTSEFSLLFVGSIIERKGIEDLIRAIYILKSSFPDIQLKIIGTGSINYTSHLNQIIDKLNLTANIHFLGNKIPVEIASELSRANLFVLPTLIDNSPNSLVEAMAVGVPSIATNIGGIPSIVTDKYDAMLFEKKDINGLASMISLLLSDKKLQERLSRNARIKVFERNHPVKVRSKYIDVYKKLCA